MGLYLLISRATPSVMNLTPQCWNTQTSPLADSRIGQLRVLRSCSFCWCHMFNQSPWSHKFLVHMPKTYRNQNPKNPWRSSKDWPKRSGCTFLFLFGIGQNKNLNYQLIAPADCITTIWNILPIPSVIQCKLLGFFNCLSFASLCIAEQGFWILDTIKPSTYTVDMVNNN